MNYNVSSSLKSLKAYQPGQSEKDVKEKYKRDFFVKLASNESPLKPFDSVISALKENIEGLNIYPDPSARSLIKVASKYYSVSEDSILAGNGSNELIDLIIRLFCESGQSVLTSKGAFIAYKVCTGSNRANLIEVPLKKDYSLCLEEYDKKLTELNEKNELPKLVFIPNPNNPTGSYISKTELKPFVEKWANREDLILVIDEAYNEFVSATDFCEGSEFLKFKNVVLLKTMSKVFGLAGLRLGFMIAAPELLGLVHRIRNPFNVNTLAQVAGACALSDAASIENIKKLIISGRDDLENFLKSSSIEYTPSQANFVFFDTKRDAVKVHDKLLSEGLILRPLIPYGFKSHLRITIGDVDQMSFAKNVLKKIIL